MNISKIIIGFTLILISVNLISAEGEQINGNSVFIDTEQAYISASPHTLTESGYVGFTILSKQFTGNIDGYWGFSKTSGVPKFAEYWNGNEWIRIPNNYFKFKNTCYSGNHLWYYIENHEITANEEIKVRVWIDIKFNTEGKYDFICKLSGLNFSDAKNDSVLFHLDPWWNNEFLYQKELVLTGGSSGAQTDYQLLLNVTYESGMQADFDDLRFLDSNNNLIDVWLKNKTDSSFANIWVEFPTTPANGINQTYFMYYGNSDAVSVWNATNTFYFYDDFEDGNYSDKWNDISIGVGVVTESGGRLRAYGGSNSGDNTGIFESKNAIVPAGYRTDIDIQTANIVTGNSIYIDNPSGIVRTDGISVNFYSLGKTVEKVISGSTTTVDTHTLNAGTHTVGMHINTSGGCQFWLNDVQYNSSTGLDTSDMYLQHYSRREANSYWSNVTVRKFVNNPPTYSFSEDENTIFLQYNNSISITNIVAPDNEVWADDENDTEWIVTALINNVTIVMGTDYKNSTGSFSITDGWADEILILNLTDDDIIVLYESDIPIEVGLTVENQYIFTTNIGIGSYSISILEYDNITGIHGFVYEGTTGISNPLESVAVYIYNATWSDTTVTNNGGYYAFTELSNTTYTLNFKKDRYKEVLYQYVTPKNLSMYYKVIYAQKSTGDYYSRHYVTFTLKNLWQIRYSDVNVIIYDNGNIDSSGVTGYDGSYVAHVFEDVEYRITFINESQSVNKETILYPRDSEYTVYVSTYDFSPEDSERGDTINWWYQKGDLNLTHQWLNFSYRDTANATTSIKYWINNSDNDNLYYFTQAYPCPAGATYEVNQIVNSSNHTYIVHFSATHPDYPELENSAIQTISYYTGKLIDLAFTEQKYYTITAICIIIFIAMFFGATNVASGAVIICLSAWFFSYIQWLPTSTIGYASLVLATILSVAFAMRKAEVIHT